VINTEHDIQELDQRALRIASPGVAAQVARPVDPLVPYPPHALAARETPTHTMVEHQRRALLVHPGKCCIYLGKATRELVEELSDLPTTSVPSSVDGVQHLGYHETSNDLYRGRDTEEPFLVFGPSEGIDYGQILWIAIYLWVCVFLSWDGPNIP
jgi:hypothetical protein